MTKKVYESALKDAKDIETLAQQSAKQKILEAFVPTIKRGVREALALEGDEEVPDEEPVAPPPEEDPVEEMNEPQGGGEKATVDLDKLSQEMEAEMRQEAELDLDIEDEIEDAPPPVEEAKDEDDDKDKDEMTEVEVTDDDIQEAYKAYMSEVEAPPKGDPEQIDPNTGKPEGLAAKQKSKTDANWIDEEPPDKDDFTVKEAWYKEKVARGVLLIAERDAQIRNLATVIKEMKFDAKKLGYLTRLFANHQNLDKATKTSIIERFDEVKTVNEAKVLYNTAESVLAKRSKKAMTESRKARRNRSSSAATPQVAPKPKKPLNETFNRWKKLAKLDQ